MQHRGRSLVQPARLVKAHIQHLPELSSRATLVHPANQAAQQPVGLVAKPEAFEHATAANGRIAQGLRYFIADQRAGYAVDLGRQLAPDRGLARAHQPGGAELITVTASSSACRCGGGPHFKPMRCIRSACASVST